MLAILVRSWALCARSWAARRAFVGGPGPSWSLCWRFWAVLGRASVLCWRSWGALGAYAGGLGLTNVQSVAKSKMCLFPGRERDRRPGGRSWAALGAYVGGLGPLLGLMLPVLGHSWSVCWRSGAALGAYVGGLGASWGLRGPSWA